jgi:hypothetical protein
MMVAYQLRSFDANLLNRRIKQMTMSRNVVAGFLAATFFIVMPAIDRAYSQQTQNEPKVVGETELRSFAKAYVEIEKIREAYGTQISQNDNQDAAKNKAIEQEAVTKIHDVITKEGLSAQTYSDIVQTANTNDELRMKLVQLIEEEKQNPK